MNKLWFRAKKYGYGWYPITWQGWSVLVVYLISIISIFRIIDAKQHSGSDTLINFAIPFIGLTALLLCICYLKGEVAGWRWGNSKLNLNPSADGSNSNPSNISASETVQKFAPLILGEIKKANSILLHCHPSPDPDSIGSALATKFALEQMGKKVTVIKGDSEIPKAFMHFPGADSIVQKNFFEIDLKDYDLFMAQDSGSTEMVSRMKPVAFPERLKVIVIDHHKTNTKYGYINLVDASYPATGQLLHDLFKEWNVKITSEIASNLFIGMYTDTGGFKYEGTSESTFKIAGELVGIIPNFNRLIAQMENSNSPSLLAYEGLALSSIETFLDSRLAISSVRYEDLQEKKIPKSDAGAGFISSIMRSVGEWDIVGALIQTEPNKVKISFRTNDTSKYDVSKLAAALGGGGHRAAAGAVLDLPIEEAKKQVVEKIKEMYNL